MSARAEIREYNNMYVRIMRFILIPYVHEIRNIVVYDNTISMAIRASSSVCNL